jgi:hypothetical protein
VPDQETTQQVADDYLDDFADEDGEPDCHTCGGEGVEECEDVNSAEGCWEPSCNGDFHTCPNCKGSGRAKDCWYW